VQTTRGCNARHIGEGLHPLERQDLVLKREIFGRHTSVCEFKREEHGKTEDYKKEGK